MKFKNSETFSKLSLWIVKVSVKEQTEKEPTKYGEYQGERNDFAKRWKKPK
jgi:hypothetical protein